MIIKNMLWLLNNTKLESINLELGNLPLHIYVIEDINPERKLIKTIRQTKSYVILDEIYSPDKIGLAFYKNKIYRYLIRCIKKNGNNNKNEDIITIFNNDFSRYYTLKRINYEKKWANLLYRIKDIDIQNLMFSKFRNKHKLINNIKNNYIILTDCAQLSGTADFAALSNNINKDQIIFLYDKKNGMIVDTSLVWYMFSLKLNLKYPNNMQEIFNDIRYVLQGTISLNISINDIYNLLLLENIIDSV